MKYPLIFRSLALAGMALFLCAGVFAQDPTPVNEFRQESKQAGRDAPIRPRRANLMRELGLTPEQIEAVRRINHERKPVELAARKRFQDAQRELNRAIYAEIVDDANVAARLAEFQAAQSELSSIKFRNELAVRKVLTPVQLLKFREMRRRFAAEREERQGPGSRTRRGRRANQPQVN